MRTTTTETGGIGRIQEPQSGITQSDPQNMEIEVRENLEDSGKDDPPELNLQNNHIVATDGPICNGRRDSEMEVGDFDEEETALGNDVVLSSLMNYVDTKDLPNCRLVCKLWAEEAWRQLTRRKQISFKEAAMKQFYEFTKIVQVDNIHFSKLHLSHFKVMEYRNELSEYYETAGTFIKEMTLNFVDKEITLEELENVFLANVPNLEFLALDRLPCDFFENDAKMSGLVFLKKLNGLRLNTRCHYNNDEEKSTVFFMDLLRLTPNIKHLNGAVDWCLPRLVSALSTLKLPNLTELVLKGCMDCPTARTLALPEFKLKTLYLGTSGFYDLGRNHNIAYAKRHTLRALGLGWASFTRRIDLDTISEEYKELTCLSLCDASKWSLCGSSYAGPGLKRLLADIRNENDFNYLESHSKAFESVREMTLSFMSYQVKNNSIVKRIATLFPALKLLTLKITHEFPISCIWEELTGLEELSLYINCSSFKVRIKPNWNPFLDSILTGLGEDECDKLRDNPLLLDVAQLKGNPSLLSLKHLRKFTLSGCPQKISHVSARLCLSKMKLLTALTLDPVTENCKTFLQYSLPPGTYLDLKC